MAAGARVVLIEVCSMKFNPLPVHTCLLSIKRWLKLPKLSANFGGWMSHRRGSKTTLPAQFSRAVAQVELHLGSRVIAVCWLLLQRFADDLFQSGRHIGIELTQRGRVGRGVLHSNGDGGRADKGRATGDHLEHHHTQRIQIRGGSKFLATRLLRRKVVGGAE